jgi:hypothetical protein
MPKEFEISIGEYGSYLFESVVSPQPSADHWESIRAKAEPLVRQLIALNEEMTGGGYKLTGYVKDGKEQLASHQRIAQAQEQLWSVPNVQLKVGDKVWLEDQYILDQNPVPVLFENNHSIAIQRELGWIEKFNRIGTVLKAPDDWEENQDQYQTRKYWLEQADKLGI